MREEDESNTQHGWADTEDREAKKAIHTPGPWTLSRWKIIGADNSIVATIVPWDSSGVRREDLENAKLIEAAPRMYEALRKLARLGNEPHYGNSIGNQIARDALQGLED